MSVIKQNLSLNSINWLELALIDVLIKYEKQMDDKTIKELNHLLEKTKLIILASHLTKEDMTFNDAVKTFLNRRK